MSRAGPFEFQQFANGGDLVTLVKALRADLDNLRRDFNQRGASIGWITPTPAVPASTVNQSNTYGASATVYVRGGTVTNITIDGVATGFTSGTFRVQAGGTINITYSVAPTWFWYGD
jgi:hypothetical protein